ncbi:hypothetical protein COE25_01730 [Bacillus sp. AFS031507]|nr:hypothetical protein COE25_01730 [Bacillus sp. AFS031507]
MSEFWAFMGESNVSMGEFKNQQSCIIAFLIIGWFIMPVLCVIFGLNLVSILKKIKNEEKTATKAHHFIYIYHLEYCYDSCR